MNILCIGDVVGTNGCEFLRRNLPTLKKEYKVELCIVNGENSAEGNGILPASAEHIFASGADVITGGNHTLRRREIYTELEENDRLLRPANLPDSAPGKGYCVVDFGYTVVGIINLLGTVYMESMAPPFECLERQIEKVKSLGAKLIIVDFHAEATSEKRAMGLCFDSKVTALYGTHTHVQTNDSQILPKKTAYLTDLGMTGPKQSVLGIKPEIAITKMRDKLPVRFYNATGESILNGWLLSVDTASGFVTEATLINIG